MGSVPVIASSLCMLLLGTTGRLLLAYVALDAGVVMSSTAFICCVEFARLAIVSVIFNVQKSSILRLHQPEDTMRTRLSLYVSAAALPALHQIVHHVLLMAGLAMTTPALLQALTLSQLPFSVAIAQLRTSNGRDTGFAYVALAVLVVGLGKLTFASQRLEPSISSTTLAPYVGILLGLNSAVSYISHELFAVREVSSWNQQFCQQCFAAFFALMLAALRHSPSADYLVTSSFPVDPSQARMSSGYLLFVIAVGSMATIEALGQRRRESITKNVREPARTVFVLVAQVCFMKSLRYHSLDSHVISGIAVAAMGYYAFQRFSRRGANAAQWEYSLATDGDSQTQPKGYFDPSMLSPSETQEIRSAILLPLAALATMTAALAVLKSGSTQAIESPVAMFTVDARARAPVIAKQTLSVELSSSSVKAEELQWTRAERTPGGSSIGAAAQAPTAKKYTMDVLTFRGLCVQGSDAGLPDPQQYWLLGDKAVDNVQAGYRALHREFRLGFHHAPTNPSHEEAILGIKDVNTLSEPIKWYNGTTYLWMKDERRNHPAGLMRPWAGYLSLVTSSPELLSRAGVTAENFFQRHQILEEGYEPNSWAKFFMNSAQLAARLSLSPQNNETSLADYSFDVMHGEWGHNALDFTGPGSGGLHCFETAIKIRNKAYAYFRDTVDAEYLRAVGLSLLGKRRPVRTPCRARNMRVVFLERERPVYNLNRLVEIVKAAGPSVSLRTISAEVPYDEQINMFHDAHVMISVHGSHLNNQLYMEPTSTLIEMFPRGYYQPEESSLAASTGVHHVEIRDNPYPEEEDVRRTHGDVDYFLTCRELGIGHDDFQNCFDDSRCRTCHRNLGVMVNETAFQEAIINAVTAFTSAQHCR